MSWFSGMFAPQQQSTGKNLGGTNLQAPASNQGITKAAPFNPLGLLLGAATGLVGYFLNRDERDPSSPSIVQPDSSSLVAYAFEPEWQPAFIPNYVGGAAAVLKPHLTGSSNNDGSYQPDPCVFGRYKVFPPKAAVDFTEEIDGEQYLNCLFNLGYGELVLTEHKIGSKDLSEFENIESEIRPGTTSDDPITLYAQDVDVKELNDELKYNTALVRTASQTADRLLVDIIAPNGLYATTKDAGLGSITNGIFPTSVTVKVEYRPAGSSDPWVDAGDCIVEAGPSTPATKTLDWEVTRGDYEVRCTRQTEESDTIVGKVEWKNLKAVDRTRKPTVARKDQGGNAIGTGWTALRVKADDTTQGTLENYSCIASRKIQAWNGSSWAAAAETSNPAWVFADMLCGPWNKRSIPRSQLDTDSLAEWASYCDTMGFRFDYVYDQTIKLDEAIKQVTSVGLASRARTANGKYGVVIDKPKTTVAQMFGAVNCRDFEGSITWAEPLDAVNVGYVETNHWSQDERPVYNDGITAETADKVETISFVGLTDKDHAWKLGRYHMAVSQLRREKYYITADIENLRCQRGDLVLLNNDIPEFGIGSARVSALVLDGSSNITGIILNDQLQTELDVEHEMRFRLADGTIIVATTMGSGLKQSTFTLVTPISAAASDKPAAGDLVFFGGFVQCLVEHIEYLNGLEARLTLVDYAPGVFQALDGEIPDYDPQITKVTPLEVVIAAPVIESIVSDETALLKEIDGSYRTRIKIKVTTPPSAVRYHQTQIRLQGLTAWQPTVTHNAKNGLIYITDVQDGDTVDIRIRHLTRLGVFSEWTLESNHFVVGKTTPPPDVPDLEIVGTHVRALYDDNSLTSAYGTVVPQDWAGLRWKIDIGGLANWDNAQLFLNLTTSLQIPLSNLPSGTYTLMAKAVDVAGNESVNAATLRAFFGDPILSNVIETTTDSPDFTAGTITGGSVVASELVADEDSDSFWTNDTAKFWTGNPDDLFWLTVYALLQYAREFVPSVTSETPMQLTLDLDMQGESIQVLYRRQGTSLFWETYTGADDDPFWDEEDTEAFWEDEVPFAIWPGAIEITNETVEFKFIALSSSFIRGKIITLAFLLDVPDQSEVLESVIIDTAGTRLPITKSYRSIKTVNWSIEFDASYPDAFVVHIIDRDTSGPLLKVLDTAGSPTQGKVHAIVQGVAA